MSYNFSEDVLALNPDLAEKAGGNASPASKYGNVKTQAEGMSFQSGREAAGVANLIFLEKMHKIFALRLQVRFSLQGGIIYVADAVFLDQQLKPHIQDFKGFKTKEYRLKKKLFKERYGREIEEV